MKTLILTLVLCLSFTACHGYQIHPGAVNQFDSVTYDVLIGAKATIDTARPQFASGMLSDKLKPSFNMLVDTYNTAYPSYNLWRDAVQKGQPADQLLTKLNKDLSDLTTALTKFRGGQ